MHGTRRARSPLRPSRTSDVHGHLDRVAVYEPVEAVEQNAPAVARGRLEEAWAAGFETLFGEHRRAWATRWDAADVRIDGDEHLQLAIRVALFHLMASVPTMAKPRSARAGCPATGTAGTSSGTPMCSCCRSLPPHIRPRRERSSSTACGVCQRRSAPPAPRARGARFPWESAALGRDATPRSARDQAGRLVPIRTAQHELHIVAGRRVGRLLLRQTGRATPPLRPEPAIAFSIETAHVTGHGVHVDHGGAGHLYGVIGPDEYHEPVDDNMFTNVMARWNLRRAAASALRVRRRRRRTSAHIGSSSRMLSSTVTTRAPESTNSSLVSTHSNRCSSPRSRRTVRLPQTCCSGGDESATRR